MTNKKYEHIGRAMMMAADLAHEVEKLYPIRSALGAELTKFMTMEAARALDKKIVTDCFPVMGLGFVLKSIADEVNSETKGEKK